MPRSIIDTESSRPAYIMRNVIMILAAAVIALLIAYVYERQSHRNVSPNHHGTTTTKSGQPAKRPMNPQGK